MTETNNISPMYSDFEQIKRTAKDEQEFWTSRDFRNALMRANYQNLQKGIYKETIHLERFSRNLLMGEDNVLIYEQTSSY